MKMVLPSLAKRNEYSFKVELFFFHATLILTSMHFK